MNSHSTPSDAARLHCLKILTSPSSKAPTTECNTPLLLNNTISPSSQSWAYTWRGEIAGRCRLYTISRTRPRSSITVPSSRWIFRTADGWIWSAGLPVTGFFQTMGRVRIFEGSIGGRSVNGSSRFSVYRPRPVGRARAGPIQMYLTLS